LCSHFYFPLAMDEKAFKSRGLKMEKEGLQTPTKEGMATLQPGLGFPSLPVGQGFKPISINGNYL